MIGVTIKFKPSKNNCKDSLSGIKLYTVGEIFPRQPIESKSGKYKTLPRRRKGGPHTRSATSISIRCCIALHVKLVWHRLQHRPQKHRPPYAQRKSSSVNRTGEVGHAENRFAPELSSRPVAHQVDRVCFGQQTNYFETNRFGHEENLENELELSISLELHTVVSESKLTIRGTRISR